MIQLKSIPADLEKQDTVSILNDSDRFSLASQIVSRQLSSSEASAILIAHNLTSTELLEKGRILKEAGFNADEREIFMRRSVTGAPARKPNFSTVTEIVDSLPQCYTKFRLQGELEMSK